jgi:hypothetical protein
MRKSWCFVFRLVWLSGALRVQLDGSVIKVLWADPFRSKF